MAVLGGPVSCTFDNGTTAGDYVGVSLTSNHMCHDIGAPDNTNDTFSAVSTQRLVFGYATETHVGAGTWPMFVTPMSPSGQGWSANGILPFLLGPPHGSFYSGANLAEDVTTGAIVITQTTPLRFYYGLDQTTRNGELSIQTSSPKVLGFIQNQLYLDRTLNGYTSIGNSGAGALTMNFDLGMKYRKNLTGDVTYVTYSNTFDLNGSGPIFPMEICQDSTGNRKFQWNIVGAGNGVWQNPPAVPANPSTCTRIWWYNHGPAGNFVLPNGNDGGGNFALAAPATPIHPTMVLGRSTAVTATPITHPMEDKFIRFNGNVTCVATSAVLTGVTPIVGPNVARYDYSSYTGAHPSIGETLTVAGLSANNNGTFVVTGVTGTTSGTFDVALTTQTLETAAGTAVTQSGTSGTATLTLAWTDRGGTAQTLSTSAADCTTLGAASTVEMIHVIHPLSDTDVTYAVSVANTPTYDLEVAVETLQ